MTPLLRALRAAVISTVVLAGALLLSQPAVVAAADTAAADTDVKTPAKGGANQGLYFFVSHKGPKRCFVVTQGRGSIFHVHYDFPGAKDGEKITLELRRLMSDSTPRNRFLEKAAETKDIEEEEGSHQFKIASGGSYSLCAVTSSQKKGRGLRLYLDLDTGAEDKIYDKFKKNFNLEDVQISMIKLKHRALQMVREADYMKKEETGYHQTVLRLNREVIWWPISQVVILVVMGFYQVRHLKSFFKSKRLV